MNSKKSDNAGSDHFDLLVIGGGVNGAGIARQAAMAGYSVCLCDAGDFGGGTSSASTKLIHGGLRYLEHYEFRLVRESLKEREILWEMAPHIIQPRRFVLPHHKGLRPWWLLRLGLFLYDHIGGRKLLPPATTLDLTNDPAGKPLKPDFRRAFEYSDCWVEDNRLVILNLMDACRMGAQVHSRTEVLEACHEDSHWKVSLGNGQGRGNREVTATMIVNAAGPWIDAVLQNVFGVNNPKNVRLVRGSHIVIPKKFEHDRPYIFQNADERIIFAIPYENDFTLIGTTDAEHDSMMTRPEISQAETAYLCAMASEYFSEPVTPDDVVWTYAGVRPLYDDGASKAQEATRDYVIRAEPGFGDGSLVNIFGGKLTTYRKLARAVMPEIVKRAGAPSHPAREDRHLPGGDFPASGFEDLCEKLARSYPFAERPFIRRLARHYGTLTTKVLGNAGSTKALGKHFGAGLYEAEVLYLMANEWAQTAEDVVFRRTKLGLQMTARQIERLDAWMARQVV